MQCDAILFLTTMVVVAASAWALASPTQVVVLFSLFASSFFFFEFSFFSFLFGCKIPVSKKKWKKERKKERKKENANIDVAIGDRYS